MKIEKGWVTVYMKSIFTFLFIILSLGFVGPFLISYNDTVLVVTGILYVAIIVPYVIYRMYNSIIYSLDKMMPNLDDERK